jgi:predicted Co/Zn/Cd cation transporter (cation efflux family)
MLAYAIPIALVLICDALTNVMLGKLLAQQSKILRDTARTLQASITTVADLADKVGELCRERNVHEPERYTPSEQARYPASAG